MITKKDISVVIQGPLDSLSIENLNVYKDFGEIIISSWVDSDFGKLSKLPKHAVSIIISKYPKDLKKIYNYGNFYLQCLSTLRGIKKSSLKYCLKVRSDELYPDTYELIKKINQNPNKVINTNINFLKNNISSFHCSDHMILGDTETIKNSFLLCKAVCEDPEQYSFKRRGNYLISPDGLELHAERILGYMFCKGKMITEKTYKEIDAISLMANIFEIVPLSDLKDFTFSCNSSRANPNAPYYKYIKNDWFTGRSDICSDIKEI